MGAKRSRQGAAKAAAPVAGEHWEVNDHVYFLKYVRGRPGVATLVPLTRGRRLEMPVADLPAKGRRVRAMTKPRMVQAHGLYRSIDKGAVVVDVTRWDRKLLYHVADCRDLTTGKARTLDLLELAQWEHFG